MNKGFSLLELAIVLFIIGVVIGGSLVIGINRAENAQVELTKKRMDKVMEALGVYLYTNNNLPCPADPTLALTHASLGVSDCPNTRQTACAANCNASQRVGAVPTTTLAIPDEYMFDAWGRKITYAVDVNFTSGGTGFVNTSAGTITIYGSTATAITTDAVMALISHGTTGHGAWPRGGGTARKDSGLDATSLEQENADTPASNNSFNIRFRQMAKSSDFSHIVQYYRRPDLIRNAKGFVDSNLCAMVSKTLSTVDYAKAPKEGPVGCSVDNAAGTYKPECLVRERQLALMIKCYQP